MLYKVDVLNVTTGERWESTVHAKSAVDALRKFFNRKGVQHLAAPTHTIDANATRYGD